MKNLDSSFLVPWRRFNGNLLGRFPAVAALALALGLALAACSFLSPDFSAGVTEEVSSQPETTRTSISGAVASPGRENGSAPTVTDAPANQAPVSNREEPSAQSGSPGEVANPVSDTPGPGPLNNILGDNVPEVSSPGSGPIGGLGQLSELTPQAIVEAQELVLKDIYDNVLPSVVLIRVSRSLGSGPSGPPIPNIPGIPDDFFQHSGGTGFVWDDQGHIVTNHHVVAEADRVTVVLPDRTEMEAEFLGSDPDSDLAVLRVSDPDGLLAPVTLGDSDQVYMGQLAVAMGNPFGQQFSITTGIISGIGRTIRSGHSPFSIPEVLQTDAPINPGNSGGPLLDRNGHVIGVNTQIVSRTGVNSGIGFAVPINIARQVVPAILEDGSYEYSWLGISGTNVVPDVAEAMDLARSTRGALVIEIVPDGPAENGGLQGSDNTVVLEGRDWPIGGDIIVAIDGQTVRTIDDVITYLVSRTRPDQEVTMDVLRDGELEQLTVTLGTRPGS